MNPYLFTITFLAIMGLLTSSEMVQHHASTFEKQCYQQSRSLIAAAEELRELSHLEELRGQETDNDKERDTDSLTAQDEEEETPFETDSSSAKKYAKALGVNAARPPNNSRLNFYTLLHKEPHKGLPKEFSLYQVTACLMRSLYGKETFFQTPDVEYHLLDKLIEKKEAAPFTSPDQLCELDLEDENLQKVLYHMLKGTQSAPSLLNYITFDPINSTCQARKINLLFAPSAIIHAIFPEGNIAEQLLARRDSILAAIEFQEANRLKLPIEACKGRMKFKKEIKQVIDEILTDAGLQPKKYLEQVFDYGLGKPGTILFIKHDKTGFVTREKYTPL